MIIVRNRESDVISRFFDSTLVAGAGPVLMMGLMQSSLITALPWLIAHTGLSAAWWSVAMAAGMVPVALGAPFWGRLADRQGSLKILRNASGLVLMAFLLLLVVVAWSPPVMMLLSGVLLARVLHGFGAGGVFPAAQRLVVSGPDSARWAAQLSRLQVAAHLGRLAGPGFMISAAITGVPAALGLVFIAGGLCLCVLGSSTKDEKSGEDRTGGISRRSEPETPGWREGLPLYVLAWVITVWVGTLQFVLGPVLAAISGTPPETATALTGTALVIASMAAILAGPLIHAFVRSQSRLAVFWTLGIGVGGLILARAGSVSGIYLGVAMVAGGVAVITPWYGAALRQLWPEARGLVAGRLTSIHTCGYGVGTLLGGALLEWRPDQALSIFPMFVAPVTLLVLWFALRNYDRQSTNQH